jgi:hypothetical protein
LDAVAHDNAEKIYTVGWIQSDATDFGNGVVAEERSTSGYGTELVKYSP